MILAFNLSRIEKRQREELSSSRYGLINANVMINICITLDNHIVSRLSFV
jgi:hypothetical protein